MQIRAHTMLSKQGVISKQIQLCEACRAQRKRPSLAFSAAILPGLIVNCCTDRVQMMSQFQAAKERMASRWETVPAILNATPVRVDVHPLTLLQINHIPQACSALLLAVRSTTYTVHRHLQTSYTQDAQ